MPSLLKHLPASHYVLLALFFFVGLELIFIIHHWIIILLAAILLLVACGIVLVRLEEGQQFDFTQIILLMVAAVGLTSFGLLLPTSPLLHLYFALAAIVFFILLNHASRLAYPTWNWAISTLIYFLNVATFLGWRFYLYSSIPIVLMLVFIVSWLISWQALRRATARVSDALLPALGIALVLTELAWVLQFMPLFYLVQAGILVVAYYVSFNLLTISQQRRLEGQDFAEYGTVAVLALFIILVTAQWI